jgi:hypothetical protein
VAHPERLKKWNTIWIRPEKRRCRPESFGFAQTDEALIDEPIATENSASRN